MSMYSRALFGVQLTEIPKKQMDRQIHGYDQEHGWVFLSNDCRGTKAVRTYKTLFAVSYDYTYFTPNTFYRSDKRNEASLRWLNAMIIDIDVKDNEENKGMGRADVLDRVERAGLPEPSPYCSDAFCRLSCLFLF